MSRSTAPASSRSKTWKGVAAGVAAIALLAGGGASFAEWRDSATADSSATITSGVLDIAANGDGAWHNIHNEDVTASVEGGTYRIVPGDVLTYSESLSVTATGDELTATVSTNLAELRGDADLVSAVDAQSSLVVDGSTAPTTSAQIVAGEGTRTVAVAVVVPFDAEVQAQFAQGQSITLADLEVIVEQNQVVAG